MTSILTSIIAFIVAIGILVTFHEFGHYWVARRMGVKVLRFSIGFGRPLWRYQRNPAATEYQVAMIPLGGYVKMLDEREGSVATEDLPLAFNRQPVWSRMAIVVAGPLANILLAILLYSLVFSIGIPAMKPILGDSVPNSLAARAGFAAGEEILAINQQAVSSWQDVRLLLLEQAIGQTTVIFDVITAEGYTRQHQLPLAGQSLLKTEGDILEKIGLQPWRPVLPPVIGELLPTGAALAQGLQTGDRILRADGETMESWQQWVELIKSKPEIPIAVEFQRQQQRLDITLIPKAKQQEDGSRIGFIGAGPDTTQIDWNKTQITIQYGIFESIQRGMVKTWDMSLLTFRMIGELLVGNASPRNITGPITIAEYAGKSASIDLSFFLDFLAIISVSLAVLNLLPIPLLDGGHLLYYIIEAIKGSPVSESVQAIGQNIGILLLGCLMLLAFYNDIMRLLQ